MNHRRNAITDVTLRLIAKITGPSIINESCFCFAIDIGFLSSPVISTSAKRECHYSREGAHRTLTSSNKSKINFSRRGRDGPIAQCLSSGPQDETVSSFLYRYRCCPRIPRRTEIVFHSLSRSNAIYQMRAASKNGRER